MRLLDTSDPAEPFVPVDDAPEGDDFADAIAAADAAADAADDVWDAIES